MESIGNKLKTTREGLNLTIEQVANDTNIAKHHLKALESESFEELPGETYLLGFLRNYSDYLGLNPDEIISLYRNLRIQEEPTPIEDLLNTKNNKLKPLLIFFLTFLLLVIVVVTLVLVKPNFVKNIFNKDSMQQQKETPVENTPIEKLNIKNAYEFSDEVLERRFRKNEAISVIYKEESYVVAIADISDTVTLLCPQGKISMVAGSEELIDLDGDSSADIRILLRSFDAEQSSLILHIDRFVQDAVPNPETREKEKDQPNKEIAVIEETPSEYEENPSNSTVQTDISGIIIKQASRPEPFTLNITFRGYCLFRYETKEGDRREKYFHKGEILRLNVESSVKLWASNAGVLTAKVNGIDVPLGNSGEVTTKTIKWEYSQTNSKYELRLLPIE